MVSETKGNIHTYINMTTGTKSDNADHHAEDLSTMTPGTTAPSKAGIAVTV